MPVISLSPYYVSTENTGMLGGLETLEKTHLRETEGREKKPSELHRQDPK